jgi:hypothetical protein
LSHSFSCFYFKVTYCMIPFIFIFDITGVITQIFVLARQAVYRLNYASSPSFSFLSVSIAIHFP